MTIDHDSWWWRKGRVYLGLAAGLLVTGIALDPLQSAAWTPTRAAQPEMRLKDLGDNLGQGMLLGVLGGFRNILADFIWLRQYSAWEQKDRPTTEALIHLATTLDPRVMMFWDTGSGEIGRDIPAWTRKQDNYDSPEQHAIEHTQALRALELLDRGLQFHPGNFQLLLDKALFYQNELKDIPDAAEQYRLAAQAPNSPFFAGSIYIRLLAQMNRGLDAYHYLRDFYPNLPADAPDAQKSVMYQWIRSAEDNLKIPEAQRLKDGPPPNYQPDNDLGVVPGLTKPAD